MKKKFKRLHLIPHNEKNRQTLEFLIIGQAVMNLE